MPFSERPQAHPHEISPLKDGQIIQALFTDHLERFNDTDPSKLQTKLFDKLHTLSIPTNKNSAVQTAVEIMNVAHHDQHRKFSNQPYIVHPLRVALLSIDIAEAMHIPVTQELVSASLLHDTIEDSEKVTESHIFSNYYFSHGAEFASRVSGTVEAISHTSVEGERLLPDKYFEKIKTFNDPYPPELMERLIIKTADRTDNLLDPPMTPEQGALLPDKLRKTRKNLILFRTRQEFVPYLLKDQPFLQKIVSEGAEISEKTLQVPHFVPSAWQQYLPDKRERGYN